MRTYTHPSLVPVSVVLHTSLQQMIKVLSKLCQLLLVRWILEAMLVGFCISIIGTVGFSSLVSCSMLETTNTSYMSSFMTFNTFVFLFGISMVVILYGIVASML